MSGPPPPPFPPEPGARGERASRPAPRPPEAAFGGLSWPSIGLLIAAGALLVALFDAPSGSAIAVGAALLVALAGGLLALVWRRHAARPGAWRLPVAGSSEPAGGPGGQAAGPPPPAPLAAEAAPGEPGDGTEDAAGIEALGPRAVALARALASEVQQHLSAPAAAVLLATGRRLVAAGSAGDWALARRLQREHDAAAGLGGSLASPAAGGADTLPPSFTLDDYLPQALAVYTQPVAIERWREVTDVPPALLPLAALAAEGVGALVAIAHRRRFAGLCVVARRASGRAYVDSDLRTLARLVRNASAELVAAVHEPQHRAGGAPGT